MTLESISPVLGVMYVLVSMLVAFVFVSIIFYIDGKVNKHDEE